MAWHPLVVVWRCCGVACRCCHWHLLNMIGSTAVAHEGNLHMPWPVHIHDLKTPSQGRTASLALQDIQHHQCYSTHPAGAAHLPGECWQQCRDTHVGAVVRQTQMHRHTFGEVLGNCSCPRLKLHWGGPLDMLRPPCESPYIALYMGAHGGTCQGQVCC